MAKSNAVAKVEGGALAVVHDYGDMAGQGFEGTSAKDLSIPFINVLQPMSKALEEKDGAAAGQLFNTVTGELIDGEAGITFLPCHKELAFVEWVPLDDGGGFVGIHAPDSDVVKQAIAANDGKRFGALKVGSNELVETHYVYGLLLNEDGTETQSFAVIAFTSTKIKPCRDWFTSMYTIKGQPPLFANRAKIKTVKQKNKAHTFYNLKIEPLKDKWTTSLINPATEGNLLQEAKAFKEMVVSGMAKAAFDQQDATDATAKDGDAPF